MQVKALPGVGHELAGDALVSAWIAGHEDCRGEVAGLCGNVGCGHTGGSSASDSTKWREPHDAAAHITVSV